MDKALPLLESSFGGWKAQGARSAPATMPAVAGHQPTRTIYLVDKPGAPQSQIRIGWVGVSALDAGLLPDSGDEHHSRRLVRVAAEHEPAREERLHLRRQLRLRHARLGRAVRRGGRRADRQDVRGAQGILQRAERDPEAGAGRRADAREELRVAAVSVGVRDDESTSRAGSRTRSSITCRTTTSRSTCRTSRPSPPPTCSASRRSTSSRIAFVGRHHRRPQGDRAGHPRAEARADQGADDRRRVRSGAVL